MSQRLLLRTRNSISYRVSCWNNKRFHGITKGRSMQRMSCRKVLPTKWTDKHHGRVYGRILLSSGCHTTRFHARSCRILYDKRTRRTASVSFGVLQSDGKEYTVSRVCGRDLLPDNSDDHAVELLSWVLLSVTKYLAASVSDGNI